MNNQINDEQLDALLKQLKPHKATPGLQQRIVLEATERETADTPMDALLAWCGHKLWRPALVVAAPMMMGLIVGLNQPNLAEDELYYISDYPWVDLAETYVDE